MKKDIVTGEIFKCLFCNEYVTEIIDPYSYVYDYHFDGDFGCNSNPITGIEGTGPHFPLTQDNINKVALMQSPECSIAKVPRKERGE